MGYDLDDAVAKVRDMLAVIGDEILSGHDWRAQRAVKEPKAHLNAVLGTVNYLRDPASPGNQADEGELTLAQRTTGLTIRVMPSAGRARAPWRR